MLAGDPQFRLLGPLEVTVGGRQVLVRAGKQRVVLATLLLRANIPVSADELVERLWDEAPPDGARDTVRAYVMRLRQLLGDKQVIVTTSAGYMIRVEPSQLDLLHVHELADPRAALALWRGQALHDIPSDSLQRDEAPRLAELQLQLLVRRIDQDLVQGKHTELVAELVALVADHPLHEGLCGQLMLALYRCGRAAESLEQYRRMRDRLVDELGVDTGPDLRRLHEQILANDPALDTPAPKAPATANRVPAQLPSDISVFIGRSAVTETVVDLLARGDGAIITISGPPGVGKTALAVRGAHLARARFPDGQIFIDLQGYAPSRPLTPADVLPRFLRALGISPEQVPLEADEQSSLLRSVLADRRVLMVLDNAAKAEDVRPLLPATATCSVLVTSRDDLRALATTNDVRGIRLDPLDAVDASTLLETIIGPDVAGAPPESVAELARLCAYLPLALRIAAANILVHPHHSISDQVVGLRQDRISGLSIGYDQHTAVRATFDVSYTALSPELRRLFRLLGLAPGRDFTAPAAASLVELPIPTTARLLDELAAVSLLRRGADGRYSFHDLVRDYATQRATEEDSVELLRAARQSLFDFYLHTTLAVVQVHYPDFIRLPPVAHDRTAPEDGQGWLDTERANLVSTVLDTAPELDPQRIWLLADALRGYTESHSYFTDQMAAANAGLKLAEAAGDERAQAAMLHSLGSALLHKGQYRQSIDYHERALVQYRSSNSLDGEAGIANNLGILYDGLGESRKAIESLTVSLRLYEQLGNLGAQARALNNTARAYTNMGMFQECLPLQERALDISRELAIPILVPHSLLNLAETHTHLGNYQDATTLYEEGQRACEEIGARHYEVYAHQGLAEVFCALGDYDKAVSAATVAADMSQLTDDLLLQPYISNIIATVRSRQGRHDEAIETFEHNLVVADSEGFVALKCVTLVRLVEALALAQREDEGLARAVEALTIAKEHAFVSIEGKARRSRGTILRQQGRLRQAIEDLEAALAVQDITGEKIERARTLQELGLARHASGDPDSARTCWDESRTLFESEGMPEADAVAELLTDSAVADRR